jgi:hypothetical protein
MNNRTKVIVGAIAALFVFSLALRFVVLSRVGVAGGWVYYLSLPIGGIVALLLLLLRLAPHSLGESPSATVQHWQHNTSGRAPVPVSPPPAEAHRLDELNTLHTHGIISDKQYAAERAKIICW